MAANTLTRDQAEAIRARYGAGGLSQQSLANEYGVSQVLVSLIVRGKVWGDKPECKVCGAEVDRKRWTHAYCSTECFEIGRRERARRRWAAANPMPTGRKCLHCGTDIPDEKHRRAVYCSERCNSAAHGLKRGNGRVGPGRRRDIERAYIIARDNGTCHLCGGKPDPSDIHLDHVIPLARGGSHEAENLRVACAPCNLRKGARASDDQLMLVG